jgi:hypothetical protein
LINVTTALLVKTKPQANFKDFKRFAAFKGLVEQKKRCIQLVRVSIGLFWHAFYFIFYVKDFKRFLVIIIKIAYLEITID